MAKPARAKEASAPRAESKGAKILDMIARAKGATLAEISQRWVAASGGKGDDGATQGGSHGPGEIKLDAVQGGCRSEIVLLDQFG